ncbi:hypothetical protein [Bradyrhizobium sp. USDA 4350]
MQRAILPLGAPHDVVVVVTQHVGLDAELPLNAGIVVGIVGYVADVKNAKRPAHSALKVVDQTQGACVFRLDRLR